MLAILILPVYILANYYVCMWFMKWLDTICNGRLKMGVRIAINIVYWTLCMGMYIAAPVPEGTVRRLFHIVGTYWYGVVIYIISIILIFISSLYNNNLFLLKLLIFFHKIST